jgi:hypothetical protein
VLIDRRSKISRRPYLNFVDHGMVRQRETGPLCGAIWLMGQCNTRGEGSSMATRGRAACGLKGIETGFEDYLLWRR